MKICFTKDIVSGMVFINKSNIGHHGKSGATKTILKLGLVFKICVFEVIIS